MLLPTQFTCGTPCAIVYCINALIVPDCQINVNPVVYLFRVLSICHSFLRFFHLFELATQIIVQQATAHHVGHIQVWCFQQKSHGCGTPSTGTNIGVDCTTMCRICRIKRHHGPSMHKKSIKHDATSLKSQV